VPGKIWCQHFSVLEVVLDVALDVVLLELVAVVRGALLAFVCTVSVEVVVSREMHRERHVVNLWSELSLSSIYLALRTRSYTVKSVLFLT
jgi:hypothetical protein